jgi:SAM-dependent methyltransferase
VPAPISFDPVAADYDATRGGEERGAHFAAAIRPWLPDPVASPVLEVGVGTGLVAMALAGLGLPVLGLDISAEMLGRAYERLGPRLVRGDARHLPVRAASVDAVVFPISLHVVGGVPAAFAEAARVVRPGGRVIAVHDRPDVDVTDLDDPMRGLETRRATMGRIDTADALAAAAGAAGLTTVHQGWTEPQTRPITPNAMADGVERRLWSYLWDVDDATWAREVVPVIRALRALPEPERPRHPAMRHRLSVFRA